MLKKEVAVFLALLILSPSFAEDDDVLARPGLVRQINVEVKRADPDVIRKELEFREGEPLTPGKLDESRKNLHRLGLFKDLEMDAAWDDQLDGYKVTVKANDGWFILPLPMFGSRGGESFAALMLMERNIFRQSEGIMLFGSRSEGRSSGMAIVSLPRVFFMGGLEENLIDQFEYVDGGFNSKQFESDLEDEEPGDFGTVTNQYRLDGSRAYVRAGGRVAPWLRASGGLSFSSVRYDEILHSDPGDEGDMNAWVASLDFGREGRGDPAMQGGAFGAFGRMFGLGMAGVKESLRPLPKMETSRNLSLSLERGETWLGSDDVYTKGVAGIDQVTLFRNRSMLSLSVRGGAGDSLPPSQRFSTSQRRFLKGVYAREFRGDQIAAGSASFARPFFRNIIGMMTAEVFGDYAVCWADGEEGEKQGVGLNLVYRFWRFPLPLGGGATYSIDDDNWQFSFAVGGMF